MRVSRQEYWSGLPFPSAGDLPDPGIEPEAPALAGGFFTTEPPGKPPTASLRRRVTQCTPKMAHLKASSALALFSQVAVSEVLLGSVSVRGGVFSGFKLSTSQLSDPRESILGAAAPHSPWIISAVCDVSNPGLWRTSYSQFSL